MFRNTAKWIGILIIIISILSLFAISAYASGYWDCKWVTDSVGRTFCRSTCVGSYYDCNSKPLCDISTCNNAQSTPPQINISLISGSIVPSTTIEVNISADKLSKIESKLDGNPYVKSCDQCRNIKRKLQSLSEGDHILRVRVTDGQFNTDEKIIIFTVDSKTPQFTFTKPYPQSFIYDGVNNFVVNYTESNVEKITLNYKKQGATTYIQKEYGNFCFGGTFKSCSELVDVGSIVNIGDKLEYFFTIEDPLHTSTSDVVVANVNNEYAANPFTINSPVQNSIYPIKTVPVSVVSFVLAKRITYIIDGGYEKPLCTACTEVSKEITMLDGQRVLTIKVEDMHGGVYTKDVIFKVDAVAPKIIRTTPSANKFANNLGFKIDYDEENLQKVVLHIGNDTYFRTDCPSGKKQSCTLVTAMQQYNDLQLTYYFEMIDLVRNISSKPALVKVDAYNPAIIVNSPQEGLFTTTRIPVNMESAEKVIMAYSLNGAKEKLLCSNCQTYNKNITLSDGAYNIDFLTRDLAGNVNVLSKYLIIDTLVPKITKTTPLVGKYANNQGFTVYYDEANTEEVRLFFKRTGTSTYNEIKKNNCPSGAKQICTIEVGLGSYNGQNLDYYFEIKDIDQNVISSPVLNVKVDGSLASFSVIKPTDNMILSSSTAAYQISASEKLASVSYVAKASDGSIKKGVLCTACMTRSSSMSVPFKGQNILTFIAQEYSGNLITKTVTVQRN